MQVNSKDRQRKSQILNIKPLIKKSMLAFSEGTE